jgi:putative ABC transport system ATP-binding protein
MINTNELTRVFRTDEIETTALNKINLNINAGEFVAVMGPSGCGKSTLLNILGLLDKPSKGDLYFLGNNISGYNEKQRAKLRKHNIGFVFQNFNLIDQLNVFENVEMPLIYLGLSKKERKERVLRALEQVKIDHRKKHYPNQLSGGQQQRVAVARAIVLNPKFILADEPTGNLDSAHGDEVMDLLTDLHKKGTTIVMVTHSQRDAERAERIIMLFDGQLISENFHKASA